MNRKKSLAHEHNRSYFWRLHRSARVAKGSKTDFLFDVSNHFLISVQTVSITLVM